MASKIIPTLLLLGFLVVIIFSFHATPSPAVSLHVSALAAVPVTSHSADTISGLKRYWMVLLKRGPHRNQPAAQAAEIQKGHLQNITRLANAGKIIVAGPFGDDGPLRGIFIMDCADSLEAVQLVNTDPAIAAGRLSFEVKPWWTEKNCVFK
ncbi:YciI family protein [Chitinophaga nivalis]|uniref:YciI family protein n=1 Tax=Chitinophaga nivalis TaxID=2991709 RepID=A0ABT3IGM7_9BACT|nr:YciI family protein [Chitinophaga nivalis]MCW3467374.1 YciI family protein [Chitinophaga nivalis]MCW3482934.1 YciI family protein [Chitinophaga nivalis]